MSEDLGGKIEALTSLYNDLVFELQSYRDTVRKERQEILTLQRKVYDLEKDLELLKEHDVFVRRQFRGASS